jgi:phosphatidylserine/phosphatidylglycerophosphate/cardiolipin synthase-like enzyme
MFFKKKPPPPPPKAPSPKPKKRFKLPLALIAILCFCGWAVQQSLAPNLPKPEDPIRFYSNQCQQDLRLTLLKAIEKAHSSVHLVMFGLSDQSILTALYKKIRENVPTTIYYDQKNSPKIEKILGGGEIHGVKAAGLMHQKILILDGETVFIGSANMTTASLRMHDNLVIGLMNQKIARFLTEHAPHSPGYMQTLVGGQNVEIWLLPDPRGHALSDIRKKMRAATRSIRIALFTFTHPHLLEEVIAAHRRGVEVTVVVDMHSSFGASAKTIDGLKKAGIRVLTSQGVQLLHHKFIYIDEQILLMGSANWTKSAFYKNSDCILILHQLNKEQKSFMTKLWDRIEITARNPQ